MADTVIAAIDALDHEEATLVGHSMGALVALEAAARALAGKRWLPSVLQASATP